MERMHWLGISVRKRGDRSKLTNQEGFKIATLNGMASLHQQVGQNEEALNTLNQKLHRERVDFEVAKDSHSELAPGLSLTVLKTLPRPESRGRESPLRYWGL